MAVGPETSQVSRRSFCWTVAGALVGPGTAIAQDANFRRIGALDPSPPDPADWLWKQDAPLRELGWMEGQNLRTERRFANGSLEALRPLAEELVRAKVEIVVTAGTAATLAAKRATATIPIVFVTGDPVLTGLVTSLSRPGGNLTGSSLQSPEVTGKSLSALKELLPRLQRIGSFWPIGDPWGQAFRSQFEQVCRTLNLGSVSSEINMASEIGGAVADVVKQGAQALVLPNLDVISQRGAQIVNAALKFGVPVMADDADVARDGGAVISYASTYDERFRLRAWYIDRILRGARPGDLPVQQPTKFDLILNLRSARALGLAIPDQLLLRAAELIR